MTTNPKLPFWMGAALWSFGIIGFIALLLGTFSMFVSVHLPISTAYNCKYVIILSRGKFWISKNMLPVHRFYFQAQETFPSFLNGTIYRFKFEIWRDSWSVMLSLVSIAIVSLLLFSLTAWKASKMRRKTLLATHEQEG